MLSPGVAWSGRRPRLDARTPDQLRPFVIGFFLLGRLLDSLTTAIGLAFVPGLVERNPVLVAFVDAFGLYTGLLVANAFVVALVLASIEGGCVVLASLPRDTRWARLGVRLLGYVPLTITGVVTAVHNALLVLQVHGSLA